MHRHFSGYSGQLCGTGGHAARWTAVLLVALAIPAGPHLYAQENPPAKEASGTAPPSDPATVPSPTAKPAGGSQEPEAKPEIEWPLAGDGWWLIAPPESSAQVHMPTTPKYAEREMVPVEGQRIRVRSWSASDEQNVHYVVNWYDKPLPKDEEEIKKTLEGCVLGAVATTLGEMESATPFMLDGTPPSPACDYVIRFTHNQVPMRVAGRAVMVGGRVYQVIYLASEKDFSRNRMQQFLDSFQLVPPAGNPPSAPAAPATSPKSPDR